ncbi:MAG TPA: hypothetical protein VN446_04570 [Candidatus Acidoferrum sp.]|nr:hypothetical protein [Candidatus Acidoferrum sp.]
MSDYPVFTPEMKSTHKILMPMMLPIHFEMLEHVFQEAGYDVEILKNDGPSVVDEGLRHVHNDTCYPALLVIGQMIDALKSGKYDVDRVALGISQTFGGCRASNYLFLLRKALVRAGFPQVPVISLNLSGLEQSPGFKLSPHVLLKSLCCVAAGDFLMDISGQCRPYELAAGETDTVVAKWQARLAEDWRTAINPVAALREAYPEILSDFAAVKRQAAHRLKVGIVGEIYMKYSPLGNNHLEELLIAEGAEPVVPGLLDFGLYICYNGIHGHELYGGGLAQALGAKVGYAYLLSLKEDMRRAIQMQGVFDVPMPFDEVVEMAKNYINLGVRMGEGWLLTAEMAELLHEGVKNIVCVQPFGCLPNHIVGKGMQRELRTLHPDANIVAVDYDPGASEVNQQNRIKMMLATARRAEGLTPGRRGPAAPLGDVG